MTHAQAEAPRPSALEELHPVQVESRVLELRTHKRQYSELTGPGEDRYEVGNVMCSKFE